MELNNRVAELVEKIISSRGAAGKKITKGQIADKIDMDRSHFSSILNGSRKASSKLIAILEKEFAEDIKIMPSAPEEELNRERALIKVLLHHLSKIEATVYNEPLQKRLDELEKDTTIAMNDLQKQ